MVGRLHLAWETGMFAVALLWCGPLQGAREHRKPATHGGAGRRWGGPEEAGSIARGQGRGKWCWVWEASVWFGWSITCGGVLRDMGQG